uniref:Uncharacterized protein n=1 Tax=Panagrellus redivivus TaxID=6233 RepID=A0A7E4VWR9_PANRE
MGEGGHSCGSRRDKSGMPGKKLGGANLRKTGGDDVGFDGLEFLHLEGACDGVYVGIKCHVDVSEGTVEHTLATQDPMPGQHLRDSVRKESKANSKVGDGIHSGLHVDLGVERVVGTFQEHASFTGRRHCELSPCDGVALDPASSSIAFSN